MHLLAIVPVLHADRRPAEERHGIRLREDRALWRRRPNALRPMYSGSALGWSSCHRVVET
jgi:hypothetical protein